MNDQHQVALADDELLTRAQLCDRLKVTTRTLYDLERKGIAPPRIKVGGSTRYPKSLLEKFLQSQIQTAVEPTAAA